MLNCRSCEVMPEGRACLQHTCLDCGQPADAVHGIDGLACPEAGR